MEFKLLPKNQENFFYNIKIDPEDFQYCSYCWKKAVYYRMCNYCVKWDWGKCYDCGKPNCARRKCPDCEQIALIYTSEYSLPQTSENYEIDEPIEEGELEYCSICWDGEEIKNNINHEISTQHPEAYNISRPLSNLINTAKLFSRDSREDDLAIEWPDSNSVNINDEVNEKLKTNTLIQNEGNIQADFNLV
ncbi:241_t:CDS:2 [Diversispora eburnea]|uniref:241_t:CDS:1 n=1 Tax=Diversispora eburnea TaxID=1213867 RepID=A0A9N9ADN6_9GLOM|nr:241_t:CDS:2 [Diversispora eburnea]